MKSQPADDDGQRKALTLRLKLAAWRQLRQLAVDKDSSVHELLIEALNDYFKKEGKPPTA